MLVRVRREGEFWFPVKDSQESDATIDVSEEVAEMYADITMEFMLMSNTIGAMIQVDELRDAG